MERKNLTSLLTDFEQRGSEIAIVTPRGLRQIKTTYRELAALSARFAAELIDRRIGKGERVLLWGDNGAEWVAAFFGCVSRGVLPVPLDVTGSASFAERVIAEISPRLIVANRDKLSELEAGPWLLALEDLSEAITREQAASIGDLAAEDPLQIVFTSGTTGEPKGVVHTHGNVLASLKPIEAELQKYLKYERPFHPIRILHTLPLSHVFGQFMGLWIPPLLGAEIYYQPRLVAAELVEQIRRERISVLAAVPRVLELVKAHIAARVPNLAAHLEAAQTWKAWQRWWRFRDVHRLFGFKFWAFVCGGAALPEEGEKFWNRLGFVVVQGYGMTETTALVSLNHPFRAAQGTIGQVLPGREVQLSDEGEVMVRGATISDMTWQGGKLQRGAGDWLRTGDLAEFDKDGNLRFRGRKKDTIVTSAGLNIHPEDLEAALMRQPGVRASAVIETNSESGPEPLSVLVLDAEANPETVVQAANRTLADFQRIQRWLIWPEPDLPRTSTGKVLRREIARRITAGELEQATPQTGKETELNLDSLGRVQLQAQIEQQHGVAIEDSAIQNVKSEEDLQQLIRTMPSAPQRRQREERHIYPRWPWHPIQQVIRNVFLELIAMPIARFLAKPEVRSSVRKWPDSPMLIVANHITSYDAAMVLLALPSRVRRRMAIAMSGEMLLDYRRGRNQGHWFLNFLAPIAYFLITALFNVFPLPQRSGFQRSFRHAGEAMDRGYSVLVFPEGRRSDDGTLQSFKSGAGLLWKELNAPALPVFLSGLGELKVRRKGWFRSGTIRVSVGEPLHFERDCSPQQLTARLVQAVLRAGSQL